MGDHTECIEVDYDTRFLAYKDLVDFFWSNHNPQRPKYKGRQYMSLLLFRDEEQERVAHILKDRWKQKLNFEIETEIQPFQQFFRAEDTHQKYLLKRYPMAFDSIRALFPTFHHFVDSTLAARVNGFVRGYGSIREILYELEEWELEKEQLTRAKECLSSLKW